MASSKLNLNDVLMKKNGQNSTNSTPTGPATVAAALKNKNIEERIEHYKKIETALANGSQEFRSTSKEVKGCFAAMLRDLIQSRGEAQECTGTQEKRQSSDDIVQLKGRLRESSNLIEKLNEKVEQLEQAKKEAQQKAESKKEPARQQNNQQINSHTGRAGANESPWQTFRRNARADNQTNSTANGTSSQRPIEDRKKHREMKERVVNREHKKSVTLVIEKRPTTLITCEEINKKIEELLAPIDSEVRFEEVNLNKSGKTVVRFRSEEHFETVNQALQPIEQEAEIRRLKGSKSIKISGIPKRVTKENIESDLRNVFGAVGYLSVRLQSNAKFKYNRCFVTMSEDAAINLCKQGELRLGFRQCRVEPNLDPLQCFRCLGFGHPAYRNGVLACTNEPVCRECNGKHETRLHQEAASHSESVLEQSGQEEIMPADEKCSNCGVTGHKAYHRQCAVFKKVQANLYKQW